MSELEWTFEPNIQSGSFVSKHSTFIKFRGVWEYYVVENGLERFAGYIEKPKQVEILDRALEVAKKG